MRNKTLLVGLAAIATAGSANAAVVFNTISEASWKSNRPAAYTTFSYYTDTLHNIAQSGSSVTGGHGWGVFTASGNGGTSVTADTIAPNMIVAANTAPALTSVTFTFSQSAGAASGTGMFGLGFYFNSSDITDIIVEAVNGGTNSVNFAGTSAPVWVGFWETGGQAITSVTFTMTAGATLEIQNLVYGLVPAPGAIALVGVAGLVGSRRRRA